MEALDHDEIKLGVGVGTIGHSMKDVAHINKGKRTKRQRHQSPIPFPITTAATHSSSSHHYPIPSPATSSEILAGSSAATTDEDEDTAMCLILLSKGFSSSSQAREEKPPKVETDEFSVYKFNSKRYLQASNTTAAAANGKAGIYVYECKTCSRTFPSFQALGGHRASHKKPKTSIDLEEKKKPLIALSHLSDSEEPPAPPAPPPPSPPWPPQEPPIKRNSSSSSSLSLQLTTRPLFGINPNPNKSPKLHECSICGAEFNSGQALGGHMRRHRLPSTTTTTTTATTAADPTLSLVPLSPIETEISDEIKRSRNDGLCLDLNLPAPEDHQDHHLHHHNQRDSKFAFASKQEQQQQQQPQPSLVLSTRPTLVDCHY